MTRLSVEDMKFIQLEILKSFVDYCEKNNLDYYLCGGTLLGAVRHHGFIPWDDDIDVMMPRSSYEKFLEKYEHENYEIFDCWRREDYYYPFAKLVDSSTLIIEKTSVPTSFGIYIDIFPIDILPSSLLWCRLIYAKRFYYDIKMSSKTAINKKRDFVHQGLYMISKIIFKNSDLLSTVRKIDKYSQKYESKNTKKSGRINWGYGTREIMPSEVYDDYVLCSFEGIQCRIPKGFDRLLTSMYGEYMKLPPKEKQIYMHDVEIYKL